MNRLDEMSPDERRDLEKKKNELDRLFQAVYHTPAGKQMFNLMHKQFVEVVIAHPGEGIDQIYSRQGKADVVRMMFQAVHDADDYRDRELKLDEIRKEAEASSK